jgi:hypothetical protein
MSKYLDLTQNVYSVFASQAWQAYDIPTHPANYLPTTANKEFVRVHILPGGISVNALSVSGVLQLEIFTEASLGNKRINEIASALDDVLQNKSVNTTQMFGSTLTYLGKDKVNTSLVRAIYTVTFTHFGSFS